MFSAYWWIDIILMGAFISVFSKSIQSAAGLNTLKPAANGGRYLLCKSLPCYFTFTIQKYIYPSVIIFINENFERAGECAFAEVKAYSSSKLPQAM